MTNYLNPIKQTTSKNAPSSTKTSEDQSNKQTEEKKKVDGKTLGLAGAILGAVVLAGIAIAKKKINKNTIKAVNKSIENSPHKTEQVIQQIAETSVSPVIAAENIVKKPEEMARKKLIQLYDNIAQEAAKKGNSKRNGIYSSFGERVKNGDFTPEDIYNKLFNELYGNIRKADYPIDARFNPKIEEITGQSTSLMQVKAENGWHYRLPANRRQFGWSTKGKSEHRISINATTNEELIKKLDDLFGNGQIKGYYKTPDQSASWLDRHDPITIYLHEPPSEKILKQIEETAKPYIRSEEDVLVGNKFAAGLALEQSPQIEEITNLLEEAKKIDTNLEQALRKNFTNNGSLKASAGQITAAKRLLMDLKT